MPTHQFLFCSSVCVPFSLQVLEGSQEVAQGQVSVDTQERRPCGDQSQASDVEGSQNTGLWARPVLGTGVVMMLRPPALSSCLGHEGVTTGA